MDQVVVEQSKKEYAVIGLSCRMPGGCQTPQELWELLVSGRDAVGEFPEWRWDMDGFHHPDPRIPGRSYTRAGACLGENTLTEFDAGFFGISPLEASRMSPQQRLLLECAWESLEDAGIRADRLAGTPVGVYVGICNDHYGELQNDDSQSANAFTNTGGALSIAANRISHALDLRGPSMAIDTACSSSLIALHLAMTGLAVGDCSMALVGGVSLILRPETTIGFCKASMLSKQGRCQSFSADGDGFVRAEGASVIALKPLEQAVKDGNRIYAVVCATAANACGHTAGISLPSQAAQEELLRKTIQRADIAASQVTYFEAHGPGTKAGDPIEVGALGAVLGCDRSEPLLVGSVKSNIGHLEGASGMAGLMKLCLSMSQRIIPGQLHCRNLNPEIDFEGLGVSPVLKTRAWPKDGQYAGISSFGFGGANACAILRRYDAPTATVPSQEACTFPVVVPLSARSATALAGQASSLAEHLRSPQAASTGLSDLQRTLGEHRSHHEHRAVLKVGSMPALLEALDALSQGEEHPLVEHGRSTPSPAPLTFVFCGNGAHHATMGKGLYAESVFFRETIAELDAFFVPMTGWSLAEWFSGGLTLDLSYTEVVQPLVFALQVCLVRSLVELGIRPAAVVGHSVGEVAGAWCAGILSLEQAVRVIVHRSAVQALTRGAGTMAAIGMEASAVQSLLVRYPGLVLAADNAPESVTVSGPRDQLTLLVDDVQAMGKFARLLDLEYAFHHPVCFGPAIGTLIADGHNHFLEIGPHPIMRGYLSAQLSSRKVNGQVSETLRREADGLEQVASIVGRLYVNGHEPDWSRLAPNGRPVTLPTYVFDRSRHWNAPRPRVGESSLLREHPLLGVRMPGPNASWSNSLDPVTTPWLADHRVDGAVVVPGACFAEMLLAAARLLHDSEQVGLDDLRILRALTLEDGQVTLVRTQVESGGGRVTISSKLSEGEWQCHAEGRIRRLDPGEGQTSETSPVVEPGSGLDLYREAAARGLEYGAAFQAVQGLTVDGTVVWGDLSLPEGTGDPQALLAHPVLIDAGLQLLFGLMGTRPECAGRSYLPVRFDSLRRLGPLGRASRCRARVVHLDGCSVVADLAWFDGEGTCRLDCRGVRLLAMSFQRSQQLLEDPILYREEWRADAEVGIETAEVEQHPLTGRQLVCADAGGRLAAWLGTVGADTVWIGAGECQSEEELRAILATQGPFERVLDGRSLDIHGNAWEGLAQGAIAHQQLIAALAKNDRESHLPRLVVLTSGLIDAIDAAGCSQSPAWGLVGAAMNEHPSWDIRLIDLSPVTSSQEELLLLTQEIDRPAGEQEVALRRETRLLPRIERGSAREFLARRSSRPGRLQIGHPGRLESLHFMEEEACEPGAGQVALRVTAVGLNYKDVLIAMGLLTSEVLEHGFSGMELGLEASGVVESLGAGVTGLAPGDRVLAFAPGTFATRLLAPAALVVKLPAGLDPLAAATLPTVMATVWYSLVEVARVKRGETVLVHGGAGGVGLAAVQICRHLGARVIASAGTTEKRDYLLSLGVEAVVDSRSLAFVDQVRNVTGGAGVDVVLNSLAGEAILQGVKLLKPYGRFLELGKRDFLADSRIGLAPFARNLSFHGIDLDQLLAERPEQVTAILQTILELVAAGELQPLPYRSFAADDVEDAFRCLQQSAHIGKIVVDLSVAPTMVPNPVGFRVARKDGTYLVTGGLTGLGLETGRWLARQGAGALVLCGRRGMQTPGIEEALDELSVMGCHVEVAALDVTDGSQVEELLNRIRRQGPPLRGIFHAAMVLDDGMVVNLTPERIRRVTGPKIAGVEHLDRLSRRDPLDHFVVYASIAGMFSVSGQGSYNAANRFLDRLMERRRAEGFPGLAVDWPSIADIGVVARSAELSHRPGVLRAMEPMLSAMVLQYLHLFLSAGCVRIGLGRFDWNRWPGARLARFARYIDEARKGAASGATTEDLKARLAEADLASRQVLIEEVVVRSLARILGEDSDRLDREISLSKLGLDSLMSVELSHVLNDAVGVEIPVMHLLQNRNAVDVAAWLAERCGEVTAALSECACLDLGTVDARPLLVCLPPTGAGRRAFANLSETAAADWRVAAAQLPAHEGRSESPVAGIEATADCLAAELLAQPEQPTVLLGVSRGAILAYATACRLTAAGRPPKAVVVAGHAAPGSAEFFSPLQERLLELSDGDRELPVRELRELLAQISPGSQEMDDGFLRQVLPLFNSMLADLRGWRSPGQPLPCPIFAVTAQRDEHFSPASHQEWSMLGSAYHQTDCDTDHAGLTSADHLLPTLAAILGSVEINIL